MTEKPWKCETCGNALGYVEKCNGVRKLRLTAMIAPAPIWIAGDATITCPMCGEPRTWEAGQDALTEYIQRWRDGHPVDMTE